MEFTVLNSDMRLQIFAIIRAEKIVKFAGFNFSMYVFDDGGKKAKIPTDHERDNLKNQQKLFSFHLSSYS